MPRACMTGSLRTRPRCTAFAGNGSRDEALRLWQLRTRGQRPLIIHTDKIPDPYDHVMEDEIHACPCGAEILPADAHH
jgi:hypothetical protein